MKKMKGFRASEEQQEQLIKKSEELGLNESQVIIKGLEWILGQDAETISKIEEYSKRMSMSEPEFIQAVLLKWVGGLEASLEIYGHMTVELLLIKALTVKGQFDLYKDQYRKKFEKTILSGAMRKEQHGIPLTKQERNMAIKYRMGKTWLDSEEYEREREMQAEIERMVKDGEAAFWIEED